MAREQRNSDMVIENVEPGAFYQGVFPGGFTDATTGIHIPGPKVEVDPVLRSVVKVTEMPDPIQLPTHKSVFEYTDKDRKVRERVEVRFDRNDDYDYHSVFTMALGTGIIRRVDDKDVEEKYPNAWEKREDRIVFSDEKVVRPMADLVDEFQQDQLSKRKEETQTIDRRPAGGGGNPPPPPKND